MFLFGFSLFDILLKKSIERMREMMRYKEEPWNQQSQQKIKFNTGDENKQQEKQSSHPPKTSNKKQNRKKRKCLNI